MYISDWRQIQRERSSSLILDQNKSYYDNNQGNHEIHDKYKMSSVTFHCFLLSNFGTGWVKSLSKIQPVQYGFRATAYFW